MEGSAFGATVFHDGARRSASAFVWGATLAYRYDEDPQAHDVFLEEITLNSKRVVNMCARWTARSSAE